MRSWHLYDTATGESLGFWRGAGIWEAIVAYARWLGREPFEMPAITGAEVVGIGDQLPARRLEGAAQGMYLVRIALSVAEALTGWPPKTGMVYREVPSLDAELPAVFRDPLAPFTVSRAVIMDFHRGVRLLRAAARSCPDCGSPTRDSHWFGCKLANQLPSETVGGDNAHD